MIDSYSFGRIVVDGKRYTTDVIIFPDRVRDNWWRKEGHRLHIEDIEALVREKPDVIVVGTGDFGLMKVLSETKGFIESKKIELIIVRTKKACKVYNQLNSKNKNKKVVAALHLTC
jgi:hypothetical protein